MFRKGIRHILLFIFLLQLIFLLYSWKTGTYLTPDSYEYIAQSENILNEHSIYSGNLNDLFDPVLQTRRPPLYGIMIASVTGIFNSYFFLLLLQSCMGLFVIYLIVKKIKPTGSKILYGLPIALLIFPSYFILNVTIMADALFMFLIFMAFLSFISYIKSNSSRDLYFHGLWLALAVLCKPVLILIWIPELAFFIFLFFRKKIRPSHLIIPIFPLLSVLMLSYYNYTKTGYFHYSSLKETNLLAYNAKNTLLLKHSPEQTDAILENIFETSPDKENFKAYSSHLYGEGTKIILNNIPGYILLQTKGMINFFLDIGRYDIFSFLYPDFKGDDKGIKYHWNEGGMAAVWTYLNGFGLPYLLYSIVILIGNLTLLGLFISFMFDKKIPLEERLISLLLVGYICIFTGPIGSARFRVAIYPILLWTGLKSSDSILSKKTNHESVKASA